MYTFQEISQIIEAKPLQITQAQTRIHHLLIDSRKIAYPAYSLFFAIQGARHDGHTFLKDLYQKGVRNFVLEKAPKNQAGFPEANMLQVNDTVAALQRLAATHRTRFAYPIIAVTGSNAKTIVKEWLAQILACEFNIIKSPKSFNSQVGVPLSVWQMQENHNLAIFEAGISQPGEMALLEQIIQPTLGLFTNIGSAHDEGFADRKQKIYEKLKLFKHCHTIFYCADHQDIHQAIQKTYAMRSQLVSWSSQNVNAQFFLKEIIHKSTASILQVVFQDQTHTFDVPFQDEASLENMMHCLCIALYLGLPADLLNQELQALEAPEMRLSLKEGMNQSYLIDDSYNNDLAGLEIALDFLNTQKSKPHKVVILSDLLESGVSEQQLYQQIARLLQEKGIQELIGIGTRITHHQAYFALTKRFYADTEGFLADEYMHQLSDAVILVKGARVFGFERIVEKLQHKTHGTVLEINLDALVHNLNYYRSCLHPKTKLMIMVKAFAYGSGSAEVASLLQFHRVDYLAVAYADEGVFLRQKGIHLPIMVMNPELASLDKIIQFRLEPELYSFRILRQFLEHLDMHFPHIQDYPIHLKIDTGMHRLGFEVSETDELCTLIRERFPGKLNVKSVFSHLAGADETIHEDFSQEQIKTFKQCTAKIQQALEYTVIRHILNSPGILRFPEAHLDMVRLGIGLYGIEANTLYQHKLAAIGTFKTYISQIKHVPQGKTIGYGRKGIATQNTKIATIAIGYADGFSRKLSNGTGSVVVNGHEVPVIGNVCMDYGYD